MSTKTNFSLPMFLRRGASFAGSMRVDLATGTKSWVSNPDVEVHFDVVNGLRFIHTVLHKGEVIPLAKVFPESDYALNKEDGIMYCAIKNPNKEVYGDYDYITYPYDDVMHFSGGKATLGLYDNKAYQTFMDNNAVLHSKS